MILSGDNYQLNLVQGQVNVKFYSPEEKASIQLTMKVPDDQSEEAVGVLNKLGTLLKGVELMVEGLKGDLRKPGVD